MRKMKMMDYFTKQRGYVIEGRAFVSQDDAIAYLKRVCYMTAKEAARYTDAMLQAYERQCQCAAAVEGGAN